MRSHSSDEARASRDRSVAESLPSRINRDVLTPALSVLPRAFDTPEARVLLLAIGLQESKLKHRWQVVNARRPDIKGPARGLWQFEHGGGVTAVLMHPATHGYALRACELADVQPEPRPVWSWLSEDDELAAQFARLLLLSDPAPLPTLGKAQDAWDYYVRNWRPGRPHSSTWNRNYQAAQQAITEIIE